MAAQVPEGAPAPASVTAVEEVIELAVSDEHSGPGEREEHADAAPLMADRERAFVRDVERRVDALLDAKMDALAASFIQRVNLGLASAPVSAPSSALASAPVSAPSSAPSGRSERTSKPALKSTASSPFDVHSGEDFDTWWRRFVLLLESAKVTSGVLRLESLRNILAKDEAAKRHVTLTMQSGRLDPALPSTLEAVRVALQEFYSMQLVNCVELEDFYAAYSWDGKDASISTIQESFVKGFARVSLAFNNDPASLPPNAHLIALAINRFKANKVIFSRLLELRESFASFQDVFQAVRRLRPGSHGASASSSATSSTTAPAQPARGKPAATTRSTSSSTHLTNGCRCKHQGAHERFVTQACSLCNAAAPAGHCHGQCASRPTQTQAPPQAAVGKQAAKPAEQANKRRREVHAITEQASTPSQEPAPAPTQAATPVAIVTSQPAVQYVQQQPLMYPVQFMPPMPPYWPQPFAVPDQGNGMKAPQQTQLSAPNPKPK
jgi:hypothetical protein